MWLCGDYYGAFHVESWLTLCPCVFPQSFKHCDHLAWGRESWSICFSCICLFILHAVIFCPFSLPQAAACDCRTPWTFLLTFYDSKVKKGHYSATANPENNLGPLIFHASSIYLSLICLTVFMRYGRTGPNQLHPLQLRSEDGGIK